jgi:hypothetical protein
VTEQELGGDTGRQLPGARDQGPDRSTVEEAAFGYDAARRRVTTAMATPAARRRPDTVRTVTGEEPVDGRADWAARTLATVSSVGAGAVSVMASTVGGATLAGAEVAGAWVVGAAVDGAAVVGATVVGATVVGAIVVGAAVVGTGHAGMLTARPGHEGPATLTPAGPKANTVARPNTEITLERVDITLPRFGSGHLMPSA